jgi:alkylation response protein AidB-like acyl-CoA dehydrogenase
MIFSFKEVCMNKTVRIEKDWIIESERLSKEFAKRAMDSDTSGEFVFENYRQLKELKFFSAMIPKELGGGDVSHSEMCEIIRIIGKGCGSTGLALSMHQHLIAASVWKYKKEGANKVMLENVAENELILISTGARDWLESNGEMTKIEGGYLFSGKKFFASQSATGDLVVTSAPYKHPELGEQVLHFGVPIKSEGVTLMNDWNVMGMRSTGSQTIAFDKVFIPDSAISLSRDRGEYHPVWNVVLTVAMPLIMSAYVGIAERAEEIAIEMGIKYARNKAHLPYIIGELYNNLISAQSQWKAMYAKASDWRFSPSAEVTMDILSLKTNVTNACINTVNKAMEAIGGQSYYKKNELERLFRDIHAAQFHPLPKWDQFAFTGTQKLDREIALNN